MNTNIIKKCVFHINDKEVFFFHNNDEDIVQLFIEALKQEESQYHMIEHNRSLQMGFHYYVFKKVNQSFQIFGVDYKKNPFQDFTEDLSLSLSIMKDQLIITKRTGLMSQDIITFQDSLLVRKSVFNSHRFYFEKQQEKEKNDSGWYMGSLDDTTQSSFPDDYTSLLLYQLLSLCPNALSILNLPVGTIVIIEDNEIVRICDANNKEVYVK